MESTITGTFQHVLAHPDGVRSNLSTCSSGVTTDPLRLSAVNTSTVAAAGFGSMIVVNNTSGAESAVSLGIYDARNGAKLGTYVTTSIPANAQASLTVSSIETGASITPTAEMFHYIVRAEGGFGGFLQHLITNRRAGTTTDMTGVCTLPVS